MTVGKAGVRGVRIVGLNGLVGAVKLIDDLAGVSPAGGNYPVATVAITGDGAGDQTVESPVVKILDGWMEIRSDPSGG